MKLKQISVPIENSHDRLYELTKALAAKGITPRALTLVDKGNYGELRIVGTSDSTPADVEQAVQWLVEGELPTDRLVSHVLELDAIEQAFELMRSGEALRVVLKP